MDVPFAHLSLPGTPNTDGWIEETVTYRAQARPKPMFKTTIDSKEFFGTGDATLQVTSRVRPTPTHGESVVEIHAKFDRDVLKMEDRLSCIWQGGGLRAGRLERRIGDGGRKIDVDFAAGHVTLPANTFPEVLLPFLLRAQPRDDKRRSAYAWTSDTFCSRVYYETRGKERVKVPAGQIETHLVWVYPDLNDWISLGSVLSTMAKPFLPRYSMWYEREAPHRLARFEGAFGPPGAPELVLELEH